MAEKKTQNDRISGYVDPETTKTIEAVKEQIHAENGYRVTFGMAVDYLAKFYRDHQKK